MALSADAPFKHELGSYNEIPVAASATVYEGSMVGLASGYARALTAGDIFVGHAVKQVVESTAVAGTHNVEVLTGVYKLECTLSSVAITDVGKDVYASDDATLTLTVGGSNTRVGRVYRYVTTDTCIVEFSAGENVDQPLFYRVSGTGYSLNLITVTSDTASGHTRGLRVNVTTSASIAHGDLQCVHGYLTLGSAASIANSAAVYALSGWTNIPDTTTVGSGTVIAGCRVIVDPNNNALGSGTASCESALFYGQTWASTGTIDCGLFIAAGAGSTIDSAIELGGSGTFGVILDLRSIQTAGFANSLLTLVRGGPSDASATAHWGMFVGDNSSHATIVAEVGGSTYGSVYFSTAGSVWYNKSGTWTQVGDQ